MLASKYVYVYDSQSRIIEKKFYQTNFYNNQWNLADYFKYEYDNENRLTSETRLSYFAGKGWLPSNRKTNEYKPNGLSLLTYNENFSSEGISTPVSRTKKIVDTLADSLYVTGESWNTGNNSWIYDTAPFKVYYKRNANRKYIEELEYRLNTNTLKWVSEHKTENSYNVNNQIIESVFYRWDASTASFNQYKKINYEYSPEGLEIGSIAYIWSETQSKWADPFRKTYKYNEQGLKIFEESSQITYGIADWEGVNKTEWAYDSHQNETLKITYEWNTIFQEWRITGGHKTGFVYDNFDRLVLNIDTAWDYDNKTWKLGEKRSYWYDDKAGKRIDSTSNWYKGDQKYVLNSIYVNYYRPSNITNIDENLTHSPVQVFPNPASNIININTQASIFNLMGEKVGEGENQIDISNLENGLYLIKTKNQTFKLIKN